MKTKEKILAKALELFNNEGVKEVTLRQVAMALDMSQGNLNYHFKLKSDIIAALYYQLVAEMDSEMEKIVQDQPVISELYESSYISMKVLYKYKFLMKDLYSILNTSEGLKEHYLGLQVMRKQQYLFLFQNMVEQGLIRKEEIAGEYERLYGRMNILGDNWINASLLFSSDGESVVNYYHHLLFEILYPYLTQKGKAEYLKLQ